MGTPDKPVQTESPQQYNVLIPAWALFLDYDRESIIQKQRHIQRRQLIIILGVVTSTLAVLYTYLQGSTLPLLQALTQALHLVLIALPIVIALLMNDAVRTPPIEWATCRVAAELYRREIYLFRMHAGPYRKAENPEVTFSEQLAQVRDRVAKYGTPTLSSYINDDKAAAKTSPGSQPVDNAKELLERIRSLPGKPLSDDGVSPMTGDEYVEKRMKTQMDYYKRISVKDKQEDDRWLLLGSIVTALGSFAAVFGFTAPLVAVTGAVGVAIGLLMNLHLIGRRFRIYAWAQEQLRLAEISWQATKSQGKASDADTIATLVEKVENIFQSERETWMEQVIQSQEIVENTLRDKYERLEGETKK